MPIMHSFIALDWQHQPHTVELTGRIVESEPGCNLYLMAIARAGYRYSVQYGLQSTRFKTLTEAAIEYDQCARHAAPQPR
jgi:hypothetical protein